MIGQAVNVNVTKREGDKSLLEELVMIIFYNSKNYTFIIVIPLYRFPFLQAVDEAPDIVLSLWKLPN